MVKQADVTEEATTPEAPIAEVVKPLAIPTLAAIPGDDGYYSDADWIRVECELEQLKPRDGFPPLWAEIDASLTIREALAIPIEAGTSVARLLPHLAPRVRTWNVREWNAEAGKMEPVPPPSEIGAEAFTHCRLAVVEWLAWTIREYSLTGGPNRKNGTSASDPGPDGPSDDA